MLEFDDEAAGPGRPLIKVIGVGGGGGNSVNTMIEGGIEGVDFIVANTDCQVLETSMAGTKVHLGRNLTKGLGAGANPEVGKAAALEDASRVAEALQGADMVFVTAGMGGGTGTGAAPIIAQVARDLGALTVGVVTKPFAFEGSQRKKKAMSGIAELSKAVDALIVIPNDRLVSIAGMKTTLKDAFAMVDNVCLNAVRGISDLVIAPGLINVDFADVRTIMTGMGRALMGTGRGAGDKRAVEAAQQAISSPLLEDVTLNGATGILLNITGGPDLTLAEMNEACSLIAEAADPDANIIFGSVIDPHAGDEVRITVIATGFQPREAAQIGSGHGASRSGGGGMSRRDQMALPMQSPSYAQPQGSYAQPQGSYVHQQVQQPQGGPVVNMSTAGVTPPAIPPWAQPTSVAAPTRGYAAAAPAPEAQPGFEEFYDNMEQVPPAPISVGQPTPAGGFGVAPAAEWTPAERPVIRPAVGNSGGGVVTASASPPGQPGRRMQMARPADELGVEESEFDKPTYLRRGIFAPE
jgi:cell division protein FtsZ